MNKKKSKIIVTDLREINNLDQCFKVKKAINTIEFRIGQYLAESKVKELIEYDADMTVEIIARKT